MAELVQTIAVLDKTGKAVTSNKHLVSVWKEAKAAYQDRKAEVLAIRQNGTGQRSGRRGQRGSLEHHRSAPSSPTHARHHQTTPSRTPFERQHSSSSVKSPSRHSRDFSGPPSPAPGIRRSQTTDDSPHNNQQLIPRKPLPRSVTSPTLSANDNIDMALAYGDLPPSPSHSPAPLARRSLSRNDSYSNEKAELKPLVKTLRRLLEEADCLKASANATISSLQKNPERLAAVALTLAEISSLVRKMAPGAVLAFRNSAPAVFGLLASPQFLIAGGVAVGLTIVAFGGYKIVKKIAAANAGEGVNNSSPMAFGSMPMGFGAGGSTREASMDEMLEIGGDVSRIENWRRGVADSDIEAASNVSSVEAELITPHAHALSRLDLNDESTQKHGHGHRSSSSKRRSGHAHASRRESGSDKGSSGSKGSRSGSGRGGEKKKTAKKASPLRLMFH